MDIKQDEILNLIRKQEADIKTLLDTKEKSDPRDIVYIVTERVALAKQSFVEELRSIL
jgi:hypothetical protein